MISFVPKAVHSSHILQKQFALHTRYQIPQPLEVTSTIVKMIMNPSCLYLRLPHFSTLQITNKSFKQDPYAYTPPSTFSYATTLEAKNNKQISLII